MKLIVIFRNFANAPKSLYLYIVIPVTSFGIVDIIWLLFRLDFFFVLLIIYLFIYFRQWRGGGTISRYWSVSATTQHKFAERRKGVVLALGPGRLANNFTI